MLEENQMGADNWRNKLEAICSLPGEAVGNNHATWEKLHERLHNKHRKYRFVWYWAAAIILPLIFAGGILLHRHVPAAVAIITKQKIVPAPPVVLSVPPQQHSISIDKDLQGEAKLHIPRRPHPRLIAGAEKQKFSRNELTPVGIDKIVSAINITVDPTVETAAPVLVMAAAKSRLRVVHINELQSATSPEPEQIAFSPHHEKNNFKLRLGSGAAATTGSVNRQENTGITIPLTN